MTRSRIASDLSTFCAVPRHSPATVPVTALAAVIGAGSSCGSAHRGAENGPYFLRAMSKAFTWSAAAPGVFDLRASVPALDGVVDVGDIEAPASVAAAVDQVDGIVAQLPAGVVPALLGGDHTVTMGAVRSLARRGSDFAVVQFDQHLDLQLWEGSVSRPDVGREPLFNTNVMSHVADSLGPRRVVQVGVSPFVTVESSCLPSLGGFLHAVGRQVPAFASDGELVDALEDVVAPDQSVYVTIDVDVLDSSAMSATGYPADAGLQLRELLHLLDVVLERRPLIGFDVVELAAERADRDPKTLADAARAARIVLHLLTWACRRPDPVQRTGDGAAALPSGTGPRR